MCSSPLAVSFVVRLTSTDTDILTSKVYELKKGDNIAEIVLHQDLPLCGDVRIEFYHKWASQKVLFVCVCTCVVCVCVSLDIR